MVLIAWVVAWVVLTKVCYCAVDGVRLAQMDRDSLAAVDIHPLVRSSIQASMLVAELFLAVSGFTIPFRAQQRDLVARATAAKPRRSYASRARQVHWPRAVQEVRGIGHSGPNSSVVPVLPRPEVSAAGSMSFVALGVPAAGPHSTARYAGPGSACTTSHQVYYSPSRPRILLFHTPSCPH